MFREIWRCIRKKQWAKASTKLSKIPPLIALYDENLALLLRAELALKRKQYAESITIANSIHTYFTNRKDHINDLHNNPSGIGINFLETCWINWIYARALAGQERWSQSLNYAELTLKRWDVYALARKPFLTIKPDIVFVRLPDKIKLFIKLLKSDLGKKPSKEEILDLLVPEKFQPKDFKSKENDLSKSGFLVSVCIASYLDGLWLKKTIDAISVNAGYENYEICLLYQKKNPNDPIDPFLLTKPYKNNKKLKIQISDMPLGADKGKQICYEQSQGKLIISLDAHVIPCHDFIKKTVEVFTNNPEISVLNYGFVETRDDESLKYFYFNEVPYHLNGIVAHAPVDLPAKEMFYKPGIYIRQCLMGAAFCITRKCLDEIGGYLLRNYSWGDKSLGMNAYLYGYQIFSASNLICIHKWHDVLTDLWHDTHRKTTHFEYTNEIPSSALMVGYFYFSKEYFEKYYIPWIKQLSGKDYEFHWKKFKKELPALKKKKNLFWKHAVRSVREYWLQYGDFIYSKLDESQRLVLTRDYEI